MGVIAVSIIAIGVILGMRSRQDRLLWQKRCQAAYVAASGVYQESVLAAWTDLDGYLAELNSRREVTIVREFSAVE